MKLLVDADRKTGPFTRFWRATGFSPGELLLLPHMKAALTLAAGTPARGIEYVRPHLLFDLVLAQRHGTRISYDWSLFDRAIDTMVSSGLRPFFELMGNPSNIFQGFGAQDDVLLWRDFVAAAVDRMHGSYGAEELRKWYFETWNEPDLPWWHHGIEQFMNYYDACAAGIDAVDSHLIIGGPGTTCTTSEMFRAFLRHCDTGESCITRAGPPRLDFISVHEKGGPPHLEDITPDTLGISRRELEAVSYIREHHPRLANLPLINDECDPQTGWWDHHSWNATAYVGAVMAKIIDQHQRLIVEGAKQPYGLLANDNGFLGHWGQRTQFAIFCERKFDAAQTEFRTQQDALQSLAQDREPFAFVKKPSLTVMELLAHLGEETIAVQATPALQPDVDGLGIMATRHADGRVAVLLYNSDDRVRITGSRPVSLTLKLSESRHNYLVVTLDDDAAFGVWDRSMRPDPLGEHEGPLSDILLKAMRSAAEPKAMASGVGRGALKLDLDIILPSVTLVLIEPGEEPVPSTPQLVEQIATVAPSGTGEAVLRWRDQGRFTRYRVETATSPDGPFTPVGERLLLATATTISRGANVSHARIVALNLAQQESEPLVIALKD